LESLAFCSIPVFAYPKPFFGWFPKPPKSGFGLSGNYPNLLDSTFLKESKRAAFGADGNLPARAKVGSFLSSGSFLV
jgi:hypothetical protein